MTAKNSITVEQNKQTMLSTELLKLVNSARKEFDEPAIRLNKFNEKIEDELEGDHYTKSVVQNLNNTESTVFNLTLDQCMLISMRESKSVRRTVLAKIHEMELKLLSKQNFISARKVSKDEYLPMTNAIAEAHEEIKPYHFSNEADLINRIVLGCTASKYRQFHEIDKTESIRDHMTLEQINCITSLQRANTVYIEDGLDFQERKEKLTSIFNRKHKQKLIEETHLLNA